LKTSAKKPTASPRLFWLASLLFFISGGTGLAYQIIWFRRFSHVWGSSSLAFAAVGGSFLFGLGLGAYLFGRVTDRLERPLRWYGVCELLIGTLALLIPLEISGLVAASVGLYSAIPEQPLLRFLVQFVITLMVIGPPCALMGGTLPLLIRQLTTRDGSLDQATGWLYAINTFGAAIGCYLTGFHLLPSLGVLWTNYTAAAINIAIGLVSILASLGAARNTAARRTTAVAHADALPGQFSLARLYAAAAMTGSAALVLEMTWSRQLALILGGSTYAFTATLFVVLSGIGLGSLVFHAGLRRWASSPNTMVGIIGLLVIATLAGKLLLPALSLSMAPENVRDMRGDQFWNGILCVAVSAALELVPAIAMGLLFPMFISMTKVGAAHVGAAVGNVYAFNTMGSIAGATLTALVLFPRIGTSGAMALAAALYVLSMLLVVAWRSRPDAFRALGAAGVGCAAVVAIARPIDPRLTNTGLYIYGDPVVTYGSEDWISKITPQYFREGASSNVLVNTLDTGAISLRVNGKVDASNGSDMVTQLGLAYFARLFQPEAKEVLVIGFGSGCTSGSSLLFPDTRVTCCEIEPAVFEATGQFADYNHRPQEKTRAWLAAQNSELPSESQLTPSQIDGQARFSMIFGDGRMAVQAADRRYDLIISEPSNPWLAGVSNLFTQEFFRSARRALKDGGVLAQWIQTYNFTLSDYLMIVRTLRSEFPHFGVILLGGGLDTILLASTEPLMPGAADLAAVQQIVDGSPEIRSDLKRWFGTTDVRHLYVQNYQLGEDQLNRLVSRDRSQELNTDLHLRLEFDAPLHLFGKLSPRNSATMGLLSAVDEKWTERVASAAGMAPTSAQFMLILAERIFNRGGNSAITPAERKSAEYDKAIAQLQKALEIDPKLTEAYRLLARTLDARERWIEAAAAYRRLLQLADDDAPAHAELAQVCLKTKDSAQAAAHFQAALRLEPSVSIRTGTYMWANNLAWILATDPDAKLRNGEEAVDWARRACEADGYKSPSLLDTLAAALAESGRFDEAIKVSQQLIDQSAGKDDLIANARSRIALYRSSRPYRDE
jgi:spermidine synthase